MVTSSDGNELAVELRDVAKQTGVFGQQVVPVAFDIFQPESLPDQLTSSSGDLGN